MSTPYTGLTEAELLALRTDLLALLTTTASGSAFTAVIVGGKSFQRRIQSLQEVRNELFWLNAALQELNPSTYGYRITRTVARFV